MTMTAVLEERSPRLRRYRGEVERAPQRVRVRHLAEAGETENVLQEDLPSRSVKSLWGLGRETTTGETLFSLAKGLSKLRAENERLLKLLAEAECFPVWRRLKIYSMMFIGFFSLSWLLGVITGHIVVTSPWAALGTALAISSYALSRAMQPGASKR